MVVVFIVGFVLVNSSLNLEIDVTEKKMLQERFWFIKKYEIVKLLALKNERKKKLVYLILLSYYSVEKLIRYILSEKLPR